MEPIELVRLGTPALILGMLVYLERINAAINDIRKDVDDIRRNITWMDTCEAKHAEINRRLDKVERRPPVDS